jgi:autotransporter-associated beta strand protein
MLTVDTRIGSGSNNTLEKTGGGTVVMGGTGAHDLSGQHLVSEGVLRFANPYISRGNSVVGVTVASGATLQLYGGGSYHNIQDQGLGSGFQMTNGNNGVLTLNGSGVGGLGALRTMVSDNFLMAGLNVGATKGTVVIASDAAIGVDGGVTFNWQHGIEGSSTGTLTKVGAGTLVFDANNGLADYGYSQNFVVAEGTMLVNTRATSSSVMGNTHSGNRTFFVTSTAGISVGQPVSGPGIPDGTYVHSLLGINHNQAEVLPRVVLSQAATADASGVSLDFGGVASALGSSAVTVNSGATLGGTGSINGSDVTIDAGGTLAPGASIGTFAVGSAVINGKLAIEYSGSTIDKLVVATPLDADFNSDGVVDAADYVVWRKNNLSSEQYDIWRETFGASSVLDISNATLEFTDMGALSAGTHVFAQYGSLVGGSFFSVMGLPAGFTIDYAFGGNQIALVELAEASASMSGGAITAVPEPTSWFLFVVASAVLTMARFSRSRGFNGFAVGR